MSADDQLRQDLEDIFGGLSLVPEGEIAEVRSAAFCEDGKTAMLMLDMADGRTVVVSAAPGERLMVVEQ